MTALNPTLRILSLGAGVQSSVMALMVARGELGPMPDAMIFADTKFEPLGVYEHLNWLEGEITKLTNGRLPLYRVSTGDIRADHLDGVNSTGQRFASMPLFTEGGGKSRRQCTREYKIDPIRKKVRELLGLVPRQRVPKGVSVEMWIGISTDEAIRMKPARDKWQTNRWPLIEAEMSRNHCLQWFEKHYPGRKLAKSACIACPFHNDALWREMKMDDPASFAEAVEFDHAIRATGSTLRGMKEQQFVHRSMKPLDEVDFRNLEDMGQINMFGNECEGMCGV